MEVNNTEPGIYDRKFHYLLGNDLLIVTVASLLFRPRFPCSWEQCDREREMSLYNYIMYVSIYMIMYRTKRGKKVIHSSISCRIEVHVLALSMRKLKTFS